jgi:hypothetical protein
MLKKKAPSRPQSQRTGSGALKGISLGTMTNRSGPPFPTRNFVTIKLVACQFPPRRVALVVRWMPLE